MRVKNQGGWRWLQTAAPISIAIVLFNTILIGVMWASITSIVRLDREETVRAAITRNNNLAIALEQYMIRTIESADAALRYLIREFARNGEELDIVRFVAQYHVDYRTLNGVVLADEHGNAVTTAYSSTKITRANVSDREHFRVHVDRDSGEVFIGKPVTGRFTGKAVIPITRRINKADGSFGGVAMALIEPSRLTDLMQDAEMRPLDMVSVVGLDGITRARLRGTTASSGEDVKSSPLLGAQNRPPIGSLISTDRLDGVTRLYSYRTLAKYQLLTTVGVAEADVLAGFFRRQASYFWLAGIASLVISAFTALLLLALAKQRRAATDVSRIKTRMAAIVESSDDAIISKELDGNVSGWNAGAERIFGYSASEIVGHPITRLERLGDGEHLLNRMMCGERIEHFEAVQSAKDGRLIDVSATVSPIRDGTGSIIGTSAILRDVTERKFAEAQYRFRADLLKAVGQSVIATDSEGRITYMNPAAEELYGWQAEEVEGRNILNVTVPRISRVQAAEIMTQLTQSREWSGEFDVQHRDGTIFPAAVHNTPVLDVNGLLIGIIGISSDITERKRSDAAIRDSEERYRRLAENFPNGSVTIYDRELRIISVTGRELTESGRSSVEFIGKHFTQVAPPETWTIAEPYLRAAFAGTEGSYETPYFDDRHYSVNVTPFFRVDGKVSEIMVVSLNISERKRAEEIFHTFTARLQTVSRKLLAVQEDERRWLARELHDQVGQALTALKINLQVIERQSTAAPVALKIGECAQIADATLQQVRTLMLDLRPPQLDELGLSVALRSHAERMVAPTDLVLHFSAPVAPDTPPAIEIVCFRIMQEALTNILRHAGACNVWIDLEVADHELELTVRDDGKGFDQLEAHQRAIRGGSIGLLSMEERAALAEGRFEIRTAPGAGTTVRVTFSLQPVSAAAA